MNERKLGIILSYLNIVLHAIIGFAYVPLLLYYIGQSEYGLYQLIGSFIAYFSVMDFGLSAAVVRFYSKYKALEDKVKMENILAFALRAYGVITVLLFAIGCVCYYYLPQMFAQSMTIEEIASARKLFALLLFNIAITLSTMVFKATINAYEKFLFFKGTETVQLVLQPILIICILQAWPSAFAVAAVQTFINICLIVAQIYYCFGKLHITIRYHYWDNELFNRFKKLALSIFVVMIFDQIFFKTNQVILGVISGTEEVAVYSIASLIYMNYMALSLAISGVYLPHVTEMVAKHEPVQKLSALFIRIGRLQYFLLALVASGFIIFGRQFITIWAGPDFQEAYAITLLIIIPFTIDLIQNLANSILQAQNQYNFRAKVFVVMGIFNLILAIPLGYKYGGTGCAFATGLAMFLSNGVVMNWYYAKVTKLDIARFWREIASITLWVVVLTVIGYGANAIFASPSKLIFVAKILAYTVVYLLVIARFCLNAEEKQQLAAMKAKLHI